MHTCSPRDGEMEGRCGRVHGHMVIFHANKRPCFKRYLSERYLSERFPRTSTQGYPLTSTGMCTRMCTSRVENTGVGKDALVPRVWLFQGIVQGDRETKEAVFGSKEQTIRRTQGPKQRVAAGRMRTEVRPACDLRQGLWILFHRIEVSGA